MDVTPDSTDKDLMTFHTKAYTTSGELYLVGNNTGKKLSGAVFKAKRAEMKQRHLKVPDSQFPFAKAAVFGLPKHEIIFFSDFISTDPFTVDVLVSKERGMVNHPYFTGSGDHVNSQMQMDFYRQFGTAVCYKTGLWSPTSKLMMVALQDISYKHYIEFGSVFQLKYVKHTIHSVSQFTTFDKTEIGKPSREWATDKFVCIEAKCEQFGKLCSTIKFWMAQTDGKVRRAKL